MGLPPGAALDTDPEVPAPKTKNLALWNMAVTWKAIPDLRVAKSEWKAMKIVKNFVKNTVDTSPAREPQGPRTAVLGFAYPSAGLNPQLVAPKRRGAGRERALFQRPGGSMPRAQPKPRGRLQ